MRIQLQGPSHAASLLVQLNRCRQSHHYCDVFLQVGNRTFAAHRAVLACAGTYFHDLFTRVPATSSAVFPLELISPANFEKVLTFVYTGGILIDLIDMGVLYELAERFGICELVRACHATFPDLQASVSAKCKVSSVEDLPPDTSTAAAASAVITAASVSVSSVCSSTASCSSLSSVAGPGADAAPAVAPSPLSHSRTARPERGVNTSLSMELKEEDIQSQIGYGKLEENQKLQGGHLLTRSNVYNETECVSSSVVFELKTEQGLEIREAEEGCGDGDTHGQILSESCTSGSLPHGSDPATLDSCSLPESSAQAGAETSPSGETLGWLQGTPGEGSGTDVQKDSRLGLGETRKGGTVQERDALQGDETMAGTEEEQRRQLAGEIIELSDDENCMAETEEDDEEELVCVEYGVTRAEGNTSSQGTGNMLSCKACSALVPADSGAVVRHGETHLTELGLCGVCGTSFPDHAAAVSHALHHVGVKLFSCDMCHFQFLSQNKLLRHQQQAAAGYSIPQEVLSSLAGELSCAACTKTLRKDFQTLREHLLTHVSPQTLTCGVCLVPQPSLCSLLWHALPHLSLPVYPCPHCARCFVQRPALHQHMIAHAQEAAITEREYFALKAHRIKLHTVGEGEMEGVEAIHCFLCPETFCSSSAFQDHLTLHTTESMETRGGTGGQGWLGKRKADHSVEWPASSSSSSCSPLDSAGLVKTGSLSVGGGMGRSVRETFIQRPTHHSFPGVLPNGLCSQEDGAAAAGARGKWYRCRFCGKCFAHSGEFTYHLRIHTGEKPYQCKVCLRFFRGRSTMICHLKTHAGALMYRCTVCGLYFSTLKLVSSHMELHQDQLPPDFSIEQTFMYSDHSKDPLLTLDT
ncbi:zinc finger and BTB domain-containing protein 39 [Cololabis saira]|uniref:zinc finger and BTB domain-containing protein 39 n=1 Tax=Cololabis saira TaxID=129043 RepID=UPI002AD3E12B|nr:zinc finger and BTB domain-containing protein 39 [Cololabis saira]XP_061591128.1 zinc finger and BTB domain-containing protein 39 [Cololabis saira]